MGGYPGLLVRYDGGNKSIDDLRRTAHVFNDLPRHGIDAPPSIPVVLGGEPHVATLNVTGVNLEDILWEGGVGGEMIRNIDANWSNLATYVATCFIKGLPCARNISGPEEYIFGTIPTDKDPRLWMVDLGGEAYPFQDDTSPYTGYEGEIADLINIVVSLESKVNRPLDRTRSALWQAVSVLDTINPSLADAGRRALENSSDIDIRNFFGDF